jgi:thiol-disulfide isomerase/thioredoxin
MRLVLRSENPEEAVVDELTKAASDPVAILERLWKTGRIPHRALAISYLKNNAVADHALLRRADAMVLEAAADVDFGVRESAMSTLAALNHPRRLQAAWGQLLDSDPQARILGLRYLRQQKDPTQLSAIVRLLDDADPSVVTWAAAVLRSWTGQDFGIRQWMAIRTPDANDVSTADADNEQKLADGVRRWKEWWAAHKEEDASDSQPTRRGAAARLPARDFTLPDLSDKAVRLSEFRGKIVLLNFWTTWCSGCLVEIPHLVELQRRNPDRVVVVGISLDGLPVDHGYAQDEQHDPSGNARQIVSDFVSGRGMNYRVLLDPRASVGRRFNGNELPTNVLIDSKGFVRRRFTGGRSVAALEAMMMELDSDLRERN